MTQDQNISPFQTHPMTTYMNEKKLNTWTLQSRSFFFFSCKRGCRRKDFLVWDMLASRLQPSFLDRREAGAVPLGAECCAAHASLHLPASPPTHPAARLPSSPLAQQPTRWVTVEQGRLNTAFKPSARVPQPRGHRQDALCSAAKKDKGACQHRFSSGKDSD